MTAINRRDLIGVLVVLGSAAIVQPASVLARQPKRLRVGTASIPPKERSGTLPGFEERRAQLAYEQGKNFDLEVMQVPNAGKCAATRREIAARMVDIERRSEGVNMSLLQLRSPRAPVAIRVE